MSEENRYHQELFRDIFTWIFNGAGEKQKPKYNNEDLKKIKEIIIKKLLPAINSKSSRLMFVLSEWFLIDILENKDFDNYEKNAPEVGISNENNKEYYKNSLREAIEITEKIKNEQNLREKIK